MTPSTSLASSNLFKPIKVGKVELKNRLVFAPTTRYRASKDFVPTDSMLKYYEQRAENNGGLLTAEATYVDFNFGLYPFTPMIKTPAQVAAWAKIIEAVHKQGSYFSIQLWHLGRAADPKFNKEKGVPFVAPSAIYLDQDSEKAAREAGNELRELTIPEIEAIVKEFAAAAKRAIHEAKADFIELHSAHGYLLDQFIQPNINKRTDKYGGSIENRARLVLEVVDACIEAVGAEHVGIRLSPYAKFQGSEGVDSEINPIASFGYILSELEKRARDGNRLAYVSVVEPRVSGNVDSNDQRKFDTSWIREIWKGILFRAGGYLKENEQSLEHDVNQDDRTLIGVSRYYTSNPDLVERLKKGLSLTPYDRSRFYNHSSNDGYLTWPKYGEDEEKYKAVLDVEPKALA
ncbi:hypothetical protein KL905_002945 [Ogataea polymorpha]|uniref:Probable NADPH dehydrogenase n=2 Tax=Ogataea TaxID=461281 RepID=A0A1B7SQN2_9ASCO|nr:Hansenula yellow enzyme 2 [Ogataea polymorpha]AAN09953.1 Hansenula yellow enzyme 2 [Ogataea angusta]KAG7880276.1 hypothetical protein KL937_002503 [Ogataea polymorpha]KAG7888925.1 hypothetical protein KL936_003312 [Ogataea polymorpha]KAG7893366.1 hypothetical protein KL908_003099 [Ogataea polymorpha]KAG7900803.1 hypothetical protein KL935_002736 [Ogataea polymorpha]